MGNTPTDDRSPGAPGAKADGTSRMLTDGAIALGLGLLAAGWRAYGLGGQSVWLDEYFSVNYLDAPNVVAFIREQRPENWEMVPVYYVIQYYWAWVFGGSVLAVRWLSVLLSAFTASALYGAGRTWYGRWAGFTAAVLFVVSPLQHFHGQGIRPYALITLLAVLSSYAFLGGIRGSTKWLAANVALNLVLVWSHLLGGLLLAAQGLAFLLFRLRAWKRWLVWGLAHALLLAPLALWLSQIDAAPPAQAEAPSWRDLETNLFDFDADPLFMVIVFPEKVAEANLEPALQAQAALRMKWDRNIRYTGMLVLALVAAMGVMWWARAWITAQEERKERLTRLAEQTSYLLIWYLLPVFALFALAQVWIPTIFQARYAIFAYPAAYLMAGIVVWALRSWPLQALACAGITSLAVFQGVLAAQIPQRNDYLGVAEVLDHEFAQDETVLVRDYNVWRVLAFNLGASPPVNLERPDDDDAFALRLEALLQSGAPFGVLFAEGEGMAMAATFEAQLERMGRPARKHVFLGMRSLYLFRVEPAAARGEEHHE